MGEKVHTIEKNIKALLFASKEIGLELNAVVSRVRWSKSGTLLLTERLVPEEIW
jgi:hypothetical protein